ncbi:MAG: DUF1385 domain-containing protein [Firmicutes bacterium]|jgi:uncharacterized protein YqhQ|nr:DUF1385 domain-containing protein [Bacillota bacterium]
MEAGRDDSGPVFGGQAVIEGVMMRGPSKVGIAIRRQDGSIAVTSRDRLQYCRLHPVLSLPVIRGAVSLADSLVVGIEALMYSAEEGMSDGERLGKGEVTVTVIFSVVAAIGLFVVLPTVIVSFVRSRLASGRWVANLLEGALRLAIVLGYLWTVSRLGDVQRVLAYHGAEHKVINAVDRGLEPTVESARGMDPIHPRCGTSFLLVVVMTSVVLFSFFGWPGVVQRILIRLALLPVVAGVSYEFIRASARSSSPIIGMLAGPGLMLQRLTTREPDDSMLEVALRALEAAR